MSAEAFLAALEAAEQPALEAHHFLVDEVSLDYANSERTIRGEFQQVDVFLEALGTGVLIRKKADTDSHRNALRIWYLPWKNADRADAASGTALATLDGSGPGIFLTSQLNGCRFTIQYHTANRKKATVLHLAGDFGDDAAGAFERQKREDASLTGVPKGMDTRRYSIGRGRKADRSKLLPLTEGVWTYYGGDKATVLGVRNKADEWHFYAQEYFRSAYERVKPL